MHGRAECAREESRRAKDAPDEQKNNPVGLELAYRGRSRVSRSARRTGSAGEDAQLHADADPDNMMDGVGHGAKDSPNVG